jgi:hypothetical protein
MDPVVPEAKKPEKQTITLAPLFGAWENWENSPNKGEFNAVTQLLVGVRDADGNNLPNISTTDLIWKVTIAAGDTTKTITLNPATTYKDAALYRFETCLAEGDNKFVPVNGTEYTVTLQIYDGPFLVYESDATAGFTCTMDPIDPDASTEPPVDDPTPPVDDPTPPVDDPTPPVDNPTVPGGDEGENPTTKPGDDEDPTTTPGTDDPTEDPAEEGGFPVWAILLIVVAVLAVAGGAFFFIKKKN